MSSLFTLIRLLSLRDLDSSISSRVLDGKGDRGNSSSSSWNLQWAAGTEIGALAGGSRPGTASPGTPTSPNAHEKFVVDETLRGNHKGRGLVVVVKVDRKHELVLRRSRRSALRHRLQYAHNLKETIGAELGMKARSHSP